MPCMRAELNKKNHVQRAFKKAGGAKEWQRKDTCSRRRTRRDTKIDVRFVDETVWLTQTQMSELFQSSRTNIVEHIRNIYEEGERSSTPWILFRLSSTSRCMAVSSWLMRTVRFFGVFLHSEA